MNLRHLNYLGCKTLEQDNIVLCETETGDSFIKTIDFDNRGENWLFHGKSSVGKTSVVSNFAEELRKSGYSITVMTDDASSDLLWNRSDFLTVRLSDRNFKSFNPMYLFCEAEGSNLAFARFCTHAVFRSIFEIMYQGDDKDGSLSSIDNVLSDVLSSMYTLLNITDDTTTWGASRKLSMNNLYISLLNKLDKLRNIDDNLRLYNIVKLCDILFDNGKLFDDNFDEYYKVLTADNVVFLCDLDQIMSSEDTINLRLFEYYFVCVAYYRILMRKTKKDIFILDDFNKNRVYRENLWLVQDILKMSKEYSCIVMAIENKMTTSVLSCVDLFTDLFLFSLSSFEALWLEEVTVDFKSFVEQRYSSDHIVLVDNTGSYDSQILKI
jgi:hypothetical protein